MRLGRAIEPFLHHTPIHGVARWAYRSLFCRDELRRHRATTALYLRFITPGELCFDIGANYGVRTEAMRALGASVVAAEPQPHVAQALRRHFAGDARVTVVERAVGPADGEATLHICTNMHVLSTLSPEWIEWCRRTEHVKHARWREVRVPMMTLDALIREYGRPAFAKIDTEGFDADVLRGLSAPIRALSFEVVPRRVEAALGCLREVERLGPAEFNLSRGEGMTLAFDRWRTLGEMRAFCAEKLPGEDTYGDVYVRFR